MDNISHFFFYLPTLELTKLEQQVYSTKKVYQTHYHWAQTTDKYNVATLNSAHQAKKLCNFDSGWLERQQFSLQSFYWIFLVNLRDLSSFRKYTQEHQPNQFHCYNFNMGFVNRMVHNLAKYRI